MSFKVLLADPDGGVPTVLYEVDDRRVERVSLGTNRGECGAAKIDPHTTEVLIALEYAIVDGRPTIFDLEAMHHPTLQGNEVQQRIGVLQELSSSTNTGDDTIMKGAEAQQQQREVESEQADDGTYPEPPPEDLDSDPDNVEEEQESPAPTPPESLQPVDDDQEPTEAEMLVPTPAGSTGQTNQPDMEFKL